MVANVRGKKMQTHQDGEIKYIFNPTKQSYNINMNNILLWTSYGKEERA
jgi:hypothetical protein